MKFSRLYLLPSSHLFMLAVGVTVFVLAVLGISVEAAFPKGRSVKSVSIELQRTQVQAWAKNNTKSPNDFCFNPRHSRPERPRIFSTPMPTNCSELRVARISEECVFKNLAYTVKAYYGAASNITSSSSSKASDNSEDFVRLAIDLTSPWSWVKSSVCETCDRAGKNCKQDKCAFLQSESSAASFKPKTYPCSSCYAVPKCGEIDSFAEGMSVVGQFMASHDLRFKGFANPISNWKFLWAHAVSGMHFLNADGVLGLGIEFNANAKTLQVYNARKNNTIKQQNTREDDDYSIDFDDFEFTDDDEEEQEEVQDNVQPSSHSALKYDYFEGEMGITKSIIDTFKSIQLKQFSLYLAEDDTLKPQIIFGQPNSKLIYKPEQNNIMWIQSMVSDEMLDQYGLWVVNVQSLRIARMSEAERKKLSQGGGDQKKSKQNILTAEQLIPIGNVIIDNNKSLLSVSTTAIVLPQKELNLVIGVLKDEYGLSCASKKENLYFVVCDNVASPSESLVDMTMIIEIGYHSTIHLQVNPADLFLDCKKKKTQQQYSCIMNLQASYDDKIILGEAALRNQYIVFDQKTNMIGFAPAKNTFNNASFVKKISHIFQKIETVIEQDIAYIIAFLILAIIAAISALMYRHGKTIIALVKGKRVLVVDDHERVSLANAAHETMDESAINELQSMQKEMNKASESDERHLAEENTLTPIDIEYL